MQQDADWHAFIPSYDALTGTLTRPSFLSFLELQAAQAQRTGNVFSLCLVDLDRLRSINDARGVAIGDSALLGLVARLRGVLDEPAWHRSEHTLARYDGGAIMVLARPCRTCDGWLEQHARAAFPSGDAGKLAPSVSRAAPPGTEREAA